MYKRILRSSGILGLFFMLAIVSANAQTASKVEVNVPFDFSAGKATIKAGAYTVKQVSANMLTIRDLNGKTTAIVNAPLAIGSRDSKAGVRLVFNRYGDMYFLSQAWLGVDTGRQLFTSGAERKAAREYLLGDKNAKPQRVEIAARAR